ncbi:MAG TPA: RHS repeat-associated core domain-containing protein, partial [Woeseiaceae bacterium]
TAGAVTARIHYQPLGEKIGTAIDDISYTGHKFDTDLDLSYMEARYYDAALGRFMNPDPVAFAANQPQHFNRYWYAKGNPYKHIDPDGRNDKLAYIKSMAALCGGGSACLSGLNSKFGHGSDSEQVSAIIIGATSGLAASRVFADASVVGRTAGLANSLARRSALATADGSATAKAILAKEVTMANESLSVASNVSGALKFGSEAMPVISLGYTAYEVSSGQAGTSKVGLEAVGIGLAVVQPELAIIYGIGYGIADAAGVINPLTKEIDSIFED